MMWSKLKQKIEERFASELKGRLQVHSTKYHMWQDEEGELFVTLDKVKIYSAAAWASLQATSGKYYGEPELHQSKGNSCEYAAARHLFETLNTSIDEMLKHHDPLVRAIAIADQRFGKRRAERFDVGKEHDFVQTIFAERFS